MNISILGAGRIALALAQAWSRAGHVVTVASRTPPKEEALPAGVSAVPLAQLSTDVDALVVAIPHSAVDDVLPQLGEVSGLVIDCSNAVGPGMTLRQGGDTSAAEILQSKLPAAKVFKAFNSQGVETLRNPKFGEARASQFYCGDDEEAAELVRQLVIDAGFEPVPAGPLANARLLEPLMLAWVLASSAAGTRELGFRLLRR